METGKLPGNVLEKLVFSKIKKIHDEILISPGIGLDCSAIDFGEYACVLSCDPITGTAKEIGRLAVHINCNDIASSGVLPLGLLSVILCPENSTEEELETIMEQFTEAARSVNVDILGGHTEITGAVNRFVISCTAVGKCLKDKIISASGAKAGDSLIITKHAGLEGASIIAHEKEEELVQVFGRQTVEEAKSFMNSISVVKDGVTAAEFGVNAMHDVTEGGVLGAVWELCEASGTGAEVFMDKIPIHMATRKICEYYKIDPYRLISSGCMLISAADGDGLVSRLKQEDIDAAVIGKLDDSGRRLMVIDGRAEEIAPPASDELYKVL